MASRRKVPRKRHTKETDIALEFLPDGGAIKIDTSIPFLDHMIKAAFFHGKMGISLKARGDIQVDIHHLVEDVGITLGEAVLDLAKKPLGRYGSAALPMDEVLMFCALDISGRTYFSWNQPDELIRDPHHFTVTHAEEFYRGFARASKSTLHFHCPRGRNQHHYLEASYKAFGMALKMAVSPGEKVQSTKGKI